MNKIKESIIDKIVLNIGELFLEILTKELNGFKYYSKNKQKQIANICLSIYQDLEFDNIDNINLKAIAQITKDTKYILDEISPDLQNIIIKIGGLK